MDWELREVWGDNVGVRIHSFEWAPRTGAPGLPIVFIGGGNGNAWRGEPHGQAAALGRIGARRRSLLSVSRRGFGLSDAPPSGYTPSHFACDVRAVVDSAGYEGFVLFGHSMGVPISLELALASPRGIAGVALGDAPAQYINFKASHTFDAMLARPFEFESWDAAFDVIATKTADPAEDRLRFDRSRHRWLAEIGGRVRLLENRNALARTVEESADAETAYWDRLGELRCPVLLLDATEGWTPLSDSDVERYRAAVGDLAVARLPTAHDLGLGSDLSHLHAALGAFLDRLDEDREARAS